MSPISPYFHDFHDHIECSQMAFRLAGRITGQQVVSRFDEGSQWRFALTVGRPCFFKSRLFSNWFPVTHNSWL
jgi:hypothetical protein